MSRTALDAGDTAAAWERYRSRAATLTGTALALLAGQVVIALVGAALDMGWVVDVVPTTAAFSVVLLATGLLSRRLSRRMWHHLGTGPWTACAAVSLPRGLHGAAVVLRLPVTGGLLPLAVIALKQRYQLVDPGPTGVLWWCGDPLTGGVIAPPGGGELVWAKPVQGFRSRRRTVRYAEERGLSGRAAPRQPRPAPRVSLAKAAPAREKTRHRGVFRWIALAGVVTVALAFAATFAADDDPQIDLTVLSRQRDGSCQVEWKDPWDGTTRHGPFHCDAYSDPLLEGWDTGWIVSYWPWKGELYDAELRGTAAFDVTDATGAGGLAVVLGSLVGGVVRRWTRRSTAGQARWAAPAAGATARTPVADPVAPPPATLFTFGTLADEADRQIMHVPGPRRWPGPDRDVRDVPWWRVWSLLRVSSLGSVLLPLGAASVVVVLALTSSGIATRGTLVIAAVWVVWGLVALYGFARVGLPRVRVLVRAARAPVPVPKRYVLLRERYGSDPVLLFFPPHGGDDDPPEAAMTLVSPGTSKQPWLGLPDSSGECELRGWLDSAPTVVPWIDGRALWPKEPYEELRLGNAMTRRRLERLAPGVVPEAPDA